MLVKQNDATIKLTEYSIPLAGTPESQIAQKDLIGWLPYLQYRDMPIDTGQIEYFKLSSTGVIPEVEIVLTDLTAELKSKLYALDNDIISVYLNSRSGALTDIKMDFKIIDYNYDRIDDLIYIKGVANISPVYIQAMKAYRDLTSYEVMKELSKSLELGFVSNIESTNDKMTWISPKIKIKDFIKHVTMHAYKDEFSFFLSFVDFYYNLNFINVETEMEKSSSKTIGLLDYGINFLVNDQKRDDKLSVEIKLIYSTYPANVTNTTIIDYEIFNQSTKLSLKTGYRKNVSYYDKTLNYEKGAGGWLDFQLDTVRPDLVAKDNYVLKSLPDDINGFHKYNVKTHYLGVVDKSNVHSNFLSAYVQNIFNISELQKIYIIVKLGLPNYSIQRFTKIQILLMDIAAPDTEAYLNVRLSGAYLVTGIIFEVDGGEFVQKLILCRRELTNQNFDI